MAAIILAGGESRRMGRNKAFLDLGGLPLLGHVLRTLSPVCGEVLVVARDPEAYPGVGVRVVGDLVPGAGPLGGLYTGLRASADAVNFCVACDMPLVRAEVVRRLLGMLAGHDAVVPVLPAPGGGERPEPLHAVYHRRVAAEAEARLRRGPASLRSLLRGLEVRWVRAHEIRSLDPRLDSFRNVNTPEEYRRLVREFGGRGPEGPAAAQGE